MKILALDLATITGYAHSDGEQGVIESTLRRGESPGMKWIYFESSLEKLLDVRQSDLIVYEQAHHRGGAATHSGHAFIACVEKIAAKRNIQITNRHTGTIKKHATGKGNASKEEMLKAAREKWPTIEIIDDNQADAMWLLDLVQTELGETNEG